MTENSNCPWASNMESIKRQEETCFETLESIWRECGYGEELCRRERRKVETRIVALMWQIVEENAFDKTTVKKEIFNKANTDDETDTKPMLENNFVKTEITEQEDSLCEPLGNSFSESQSAEEKLEVLKDFVKQKEREKEVLLQAYSSVKEVVENTKKEIDWAKSLAFEHKLISNSITSEFTKECKEKLEAFHRKLEQQLKNRNSLLQNINAKLVCVQQALDKDICDRKMFLSDLNVCARLTIDAITEELSCLEAVKQSKFQQFVEFSRKELDSWWTKCFYSEQQRKEFLPFFSTDYTEELLELHEQELQKVKTFYNTNSGIFKLLHQRQKLWNMMIDIETKAYDPSRLFDNRGGQLLQEEKEKKMVQKDLPKIEEELLKMAKFYKQQNGHDICVNGSVLANVIRQQKLDYQKCKEQKRIERKLAREQERLVDATAVNSVMKRSCRKRKHCGTPDVSITSSKKPLLRSLQSASCSGKILKPIQNTVKSCKTAKKVLCMNEPASQGVVY